MSKISPRGKIRPVRVKTPVVRMRFEGVEGYLLNISATGALIRAGRLLKVGTQGRLIFDLEQRPVEVLTQVMRCDSVSVASTEATLQRRQYLVGLMFMHLSAEATESVKELCGGDFAVENVPQYVLLIGEDLKMNELVGGTLRKAGQIVRTIFDPDGAVASAHKFRPDAVVINLQQGRESSPAWGVLKALSADPLTEKIPVIALADLETLTPGRQRALVERGAHLLPLSFEPDELLSLLSSLRPEE